MSKIADSTNIRVYWLLNQMNRSFQEKYALLVKNGYTVQVFNNIDDLINSASVYRPSVIVLDTALVPSIYIQKCIRLLSKKADLKATRKILSVSSYDEELYNLASANVFRDIIPLDIDDSLWLARFYYATSRKNHQLNTPSCQLKLNLPAQVSFPARITWISSKYIFLETKVIPSSDTHFYLEGAFNDKIKTPYLPSIDLRLDSTQDSNLLYRFSKGLLARWDSSKYPNIQKIIEELQQTNFGPKIRVFVIGKTPKVRSYVSDNLDSLRFEVNVALRVQSIVDEPKYFSPHVIFIEDSMCKDQTTYPKIKQMLSSLTQTTYVYIIGPQASLDLIPDQYPNIQIIPLQAKPVNLSRLILTKNIILSHNDSDTIYLPSDHPFSLAQLTYPATLTSLHPSCIGISTSFKLAPYALCTIQTEELKKAFNRKLYSKIYKTSSLKDDNSATTKYLAEAYLCDLKDEERTKLSNYIQDLLNHNIKASDVAIFSSITNIFTEDALYKQINDKNRKQLLKTEEPSKTLASILPIPIKSRSIKESFSLDRSDSKRKSVKKDYTTLKILASIAFIIAILYGSILAISSIAPMWPKSGSQYTETLRRMAPDKFEPDSILKRKPEDSNQSHIPYLDSLFNRESSSDQDEN